MGIDYKKDPLSWAQFHRGAGYRTSQDWIFQKNWRPFGRVLRGVIPRNSEK